MNGRRWAAAGLLGAILAYLVSSFGSRLVPMNEKTFDSLPKADKESLIRSWGSSNSESSGRLLLHAAVDAAPQIRQTAAYDLRRRCDLEDGMIALLDAGRGYEAGLMTALAECHSQKAAPIFMKYLVNISTPGPAGVAAEALEQIGAKEAIPQLIVAVQGCEEFCAARAAAALSALGETAVSREWAIKKLSVPEPTKFDAYKTPDWMIRQYAVRIIGRIGTASDIPILKESLERHGTLGEEAEAAVSAINKREAAK